MMNLKQHAMVFCLAVLLAACNSESGESKTVTQDKVSGDSPAQAAAESESTATASQAAAAEEPPAAADTVAQTGKAPDKAALVEEAKAAVMALGGTLKGELQKAMQEGGPVAAVSVCNVKAPEIAQSVSADKGLEVTRVSLKNRNPDMGQPNDWQTAVLNDFDARNAAGEDPAQLAYAEVVEAAGRHEFRFMKAIPTEGVCLVCHGTNLSPELTQKLTELYPQDKATGYQLGDLRGAFVVVKQLD
ncbi:MAG: DUF3365 domain-containing protein [Thiolinea sp.]